MRYADADSLETLARALRSATGNGRDVVRALGRGYGFPEDVEAEAAAIAAGMMALELRADALRGKVEELRDRAVMDRSRAAG